MVAYFFQRCSHNFNGIVWRTKTWHLPQQKKKKRKKVTHIYIHFSDMACLRLQNQKLMAYTELVSASVNGLLPQQHQGHHFVWFTIAEAAPPYWHCSTWSRYQTTRTEKLSLTAWLLNRVIVSHLCKLPATSAGCQGVCRQPVLGVVPQSDLN